MSPGGRGAVGRRSVRVVPGIGFRPNGSLTVARNERERSVMMAFAAHPDATARGIRFVEPEEVGAANPAVHGETLGALYCSEDAVVEPRLVLDAAARRT